MRHAVLPCTIQMKGRRTSAPPPASSGWAPLQFLVRWMQGEKFVPLSSLPSSDSHVCSIQPRNEECCILAQENGCGIPAQAKACIPEQVNGLASLDASTRLPGAHQLVQGRSAWYISCERGLTFPPRSLGPIPLFFRVLPSGNTRRTLTNVCRSLPQTTTGRKRASN